MMPEGPIGGPRPFAESKLQYIVLIEGPTEVSREEDGPFNKSNTFQDTVLDKIGKVLMAVNRLSHPSTYEIEEFEIRSQGPGGGLDEGETQWAVTYTLEGSGLGSSLARVTNS